MSDIAMVGDRDSILGFKALGVSLFPAETRGEAISILRTLIQQEFKIAFITEQVAPDAETIADEMLDRTMPAPPTRNRVLDNNIDLQKKKNKKPSSFGEY